MPARQMNLLRGALFTLVMACVVLTSSGRAQIPAGDGKALFEKRCGGCHDLKREREGPRLGGVYGRSAGSVASFPYSEALKNSRITWNAETLDRWLSDPESVVPGNDMAFHVDKSEERREIIAYLKRSSAK